jgi:hypothetical protein
MNRSEGLLAPSGRLGLKVIRGDGSIERPLMEPAVPPSPAPILESCVPARELSIEEIIRFGLPQAGLPQEVNQWRRRNAPNLWRGARRVLLARALGLPHFYGQLSLVLSRADGEVLDLGLASLRVVTTTGVGFIVDAFQNLVELENMKFHGLGTGTNAEASSDTALQTELTTEYNPDNTRATGTLTEGAAANVFRTVATNTIDSGTPNVTEHGVLSQAATGGGVLLDRSKFTAMGMAGGDGLQTQYDFTAVAGS